MSEYPKCLYGPSRWENMDDYVVVVDDVAEAEAAELGYGPLTEPFITDEKMELRRKYMEKFGDYPDGRYSIKRLQEMLEEPKAYMSDELSLDLNAPIISSSKVADEVEALILNDTGIDSNAG